MPKRMVLQKGLHIDYDSFGKRLRAIREKTELTQKDFYMEYLRKYDPEPCSPNTAQSRVSNYEYGYTMPCGDLLLRYAELAGISLDELFIGTAAGVSYGDTLNTLADLSSRGIISISADGASISVKDNALQALLSQLQYQKKHCLSAEVLTWLSKRIKLLKQYPLAISPGNVRTVNNHFKAIKEQSKNAETLDIIQAVLFMNNEILGIPDDTPTEHE